MDRTHGDPPAELSAAHLAEAVRGIASRKTPEESLQAVIEMAVTAGPGAAASVTLLTGRHLETVAFSDALVRRADELQYRLGEGPCYDSVWTDGLQVTGDV